MTWQEQHIGIDVGLRLINSNLYNKLLKEEKDYILNRVIVDLINEQIAPINQPQETLSYDQIRNWYKFINPLIRDLSYKEFVNRGKFIEIDLPKNTYVPISSGSLVTGRSYRIVTAGATNLSTFGINANYPNAIFTYPKHIIEFVNDPPNYNLTIIQGYKYEILYADGVSFTGHGAFSNEVGTIFTATSNNTFTSATNKGTKLRVISGLPAWDGITTVIPTNSDDIFHYYTSKSKIATNCIIASGQLTKGNYYKVVNAGTVANLTSFGSEYNIVEVGYVFLCTTTGVPAWATSNVQLAEYREAINRLVIATDVDNFLDHSYGTVISSPICALVDNKLRVYHNNKFEISDVDIMYLRPPATIDHVSNVDCDLDPIVHPSIVDKAINYIAATFASPAYQHLKNEAQ
jgi:hypothetical protein